MNKIEFEIFCKKRLSNILDTGEPNPFLFYIDRFNTFKRLPIGITPMVVGNKTGKRELWDLICEIQSTSDFKEWCIKW